MRCGTYNHVYLFKWTLWRDEEWLDKDDAWTHLSLCQWSVRTPFSFAKLLNNPTSSPHHACCRDKTQMKRILSIAHHGPRVRQFHATHCHSFPRRQVGIPAPPQLQKTGLLFDEDTLTPQEEEDTNEGTSAGHTYLGQQRQVLQYMRLIEHDMPKLVREWCTDSF